MQSRTKSEKLVSTPKTRLRSSVVNQENDRTNRIGFLEPNGLKKTRLKNGTNISINEVNTSQKKSPKQVRPPTINVSVPPASPKPVAVPTTTISLQRRSEFRHTTVLRTPERPQRRPPTKKRAVCVASSPPLRRPIKFSSRIQSLEMKKF